MGNLTRIALLCLGLASLGYGLQCNVGSMIVDKEGKIVESLIEAKECSGMCTRRSPLMDDGSTVHFLECEQRDRSFEADSICHDDLCNRVPGKAIETELVKVPVPNEDPVADFTCYVGIQVGSMTLAGAVASCSQAGATGSCASASTTIGGTQATLYFCTTHAICNAFVNPPPPNGVFVCSDVNAHPEYNITACCCYDGSNCNTNGTITTPLPSATPQTRIPIACYSGIHIAGSLIAGGSYVACQGDCAAVSFMYMGQYDFSMYSCEPANMCQQLQITNNCVNLANGTLSGCCCNSDACIDPTVTPPRYPNGTRTPIMECYVGVHIVNTTTNNAVDVGAPIACDGMCGRLKTTTAGYTIESFYCASYNLCWALDTVGSCSNLTFAGMGVETCCCWDSNNCNTQNTDITPVTPTQIPRRDVIACFQGLHVNNISIAESYTGCVGDCASLTVQSSVNGDQYNVTLYTCDPTTVCQGLGIVNRCAQIPNTPISGCCCDSDVCIQPYYRKFPNGTNSLQCGAGLTIAGSDNYTNVYQVQCDGTCASVETTISGARFVGYFCAPSSTCKTLDLRNDCLTILGDVGSPHVTACCCDYQNYCNTDRNRIQPIPYTPATNRPPIACWGGLGINNNFFNNSGRYMACQGDCGMMTFRTSIAGQDTNVTMYSCDPVGVCDRMYLQNACGTSPTGIFTGCCCDWNDCIDIPNRKINPYPLPSSVNCYIGLGFQNTTNGPVTNFGGQMSCDGQCGTLVTDINSIHTYGYYCAPQALCSAFDVWNECTRRWLDYPNATDWVDICCCNNADNCNFQRQQPNVTIPTSPPTRPRSPISCYSGLSFLYNGTFYGLTDDDKYMACQGDCAQLTYQSFVSGNNFLATVYTCDPVSLCARLGISNSCTNITKSDNRGTGISGCCCNWNDCINKNNGSINPQPHKNDLQCYVGVQLQSNPMDPSTRKIYGASMPCNGECASVKTHFGSYDMWSFMCAPQVLCDVFDSERQCGTYQMDATGDYLETCCCARWDNCNLYGHGFPVPTAIQSVDPTTDPLACYAGFALNRNVLTPDNRFMACQGQCAQLTYGSRLNGNDFSATIFTCDPASLCNTFNMSNSCSDLQNNDSNGTRIRSCCCGWSDCIDRSSNSSFSVKPLPHWHKDDLNCYVGLGFLGSNGTWTPYGSSMGTCNGECSSVETKFNGVVTVGFFCSTDSVCDVIDPTRGCSTRLLDRSGDYLKGCCCADTDNCNSARYGLNPGPPVNTTGVPVLGCLAGINYNGVVNTADRYMACQGDCASITFSSTINGGQAINLTMFMCDPVQMCAGLRMQNRCHRVNQQGSDNSTSIRGCCCQWNDCIDPNTLQIRPYPLPTSANCFIGLSFQNGSSTTTYGGPGQCDGQCGSLVTTVNGIKTYGYYCAPQSLCSAFELWNECTTRFIDSAADTVDICCCNSGDNCNINNQQPNVTKPTPTPPPTRGSPLACYSGLTFQLGGTFYNLTDSDKYMGCYGNCAAITYATTANNASFAATMYTCDPQYLCPSLGISDRCVNITGSTGNGISGCCCSWNDCVNKATGNSLNPNPYAVPTAPGPTQLSSSIPFLFATLLTILVASLF